MTSTKLKSDVDQLDDLVKDLLTEVNRPISDTNNHRYMYQRHSNNDLSNSRVSSSSTLANQQRYDFDNPHSSKTVREERIRIKRGPANNEIPITTTSSSMETKTTTTAAKPQATTAAAASSIDEHLIDSLLESVQNTLKKRAQRNQSNWSTDIPINNRRTYSSSASYNTDSVHRMDLNRGRFPIKLNRTDSPTSTLSSRKNYNRHDSRDGYISGSTSTLPTHFRAASEPPPDGPLELRRMDLIRSPSRTYVNSHTPNEYYHYPRSTLPSSGIRVRGHDYTGYDTDTGLMTSRAYGPRYYRGPPPPPPQPQSIYPYYYQQHHQENHRPTFRPDGYDTDSGLISSGRLRMTRTLSPRMAVIPETVVVNNRMSSATNLNQVPADLRGSAFLNQAHRSQNLTGYETDSSVNTRQYINEYRQIPVDVQFGDSGWVGNQTMSRSNSQQQRFNDYNQSYRQAQDHYRGASIPVYTQHSEQQQHHQQQKRKTSVTSSPSLSTIDTSKKDISILPALFPGSVGLSNPLSGGHKPQPQQQPLPPQQQQQQQQISESEVARKISNDNVTNRSARPHGVVLESTVIPPSVDSVVANTEIVSTTSEAISNANVNSQTPKISSPTPTFPVINQSFNANVQSRVGNSSIRNTDENSQRSSVSSPAESDVLRNGAYQAHNVSQFWYKEKLSREDAINLLKTKTPGTFLIRDSQGFPGSYGLAVKVDKLPSGIQPKPGADPNAELVRHYLIERTQTGHVRLKGCPNEPDFANLSALVYQHTLASLALPIKLVLPTVDIAEDYRPITNQQQQETKKMSVKDLLEKGAACNVVYLNNVDVESLSGQMAVAKALRSTFDNAERLQATIVNFKVSNTGITLTDTKKKIFSRRHFPKEYVTYCGADYETDRFWTYQYNDLEMLPRAKCFGFVSKKINGAKTSQPENECHIFAELDISQPSTAIVNFVSKVMIGSVPV
ncbi:unnamed protein product [Adineta steineri]|uniref:SH2 domain-containing protein n=1 Tax=Adineta steineri TaxID=433720 RepID=A0A814QAK2_9BILA|nr:unnamed protein product [Adineta steineri]CAF1116138.1 unnamed protein product [Adineta steineri]CAF3727034.1 unnamed protein product [Adineta steineri]CAF3760784.1 unnamed protein product [Adineta steineri]